MDRGRKLRKHIFRILKSAALNSLTQCGKSQRYVPVNNCCRGLRSRVFYQFWEVEQGPEHLEPQLLSSVARPGLVRASGTRWPPCGSHSGASLQRPRERLEGPDLLGAVLVDLEPSRHQPVGERLGQVAQRAVLLGR